VKEGLSLFFLAQLSFEKSEIAFKGDGSRNLLLSVGDHEQFKNII